LGGLSNQESAKRAVWYGIAGMALAVIFTALGPGVSNYGLMLAMVLVGAAIGTVVARRVEMTQMPQLVAALHSFVGLAAVFVGLNAEMERLRVDGLRAAGESLDGLAAFAARLATKTPTEIAFLQVEVVLGVFIGAITFTGSVVAFGKLAGKLDGKPAQLPGGHLLNAAAALACVVLAVYYLAFGGMLPLIAITVLALFIGYHLIMGIGGADMPVVVSMLNSYSGWAAAAIGFTLSNDLLIVTGALVGSSGAILSYIMCKAMNRSFISVIAGGFGAASGPADGAEKIDRPYKRGSAEDAAYMMKQAESVIIIPGYGMAVAQAQHALREMGDMLKEEGVNVKYAIHPVAGRMPGHMNVLLAEANVPYDEVFELEDINSEFAQADVAFIIGANDVVNPAAKTDKGSPIYGMPVFDVDKAKTIFFIKRSMGGVGYAGVDNEVFYMDQTMMLLSDAKKMCEDIVKSL
ncbi:MAG: NAD(P)(+) transhydrogenase (Re/Si-specific) subunit beta, partial [Parasphingorhabdus sp.]|uniref:NAD(P)(+) transhydrogenase (Re/Si-specific) subunit beta n=1 Tax=Parasphingorhabdus sp. TaxID=2709688 RepID=UPI0032985880